MRKIYTSIDIGSDCVKVLVFEMLNGKKNVLSVISQKSSGIKKGLIMEAESALESIKTALKKTEDTLGIKVYKVIASIPAYHATYSLVDGYTTITNQEHRVTGADMVRAMQSAVYNKVTTDKELVSIIPVEFKIDDQEPVIHPKDMKGEKLFVKAVMATVPKKNAVSVISTLETLGLSVIDMTISSIADYEYLRDEETDTNFGVLVNMGAETTTISVYNRGIIINSKVLQIGGRNVDSDIAYVYSLEKDVAKKIKETFAVSHKRYAKLDEVYEIVNKDGKLLRINQYEITEVIYYRLIEMLKIVKNEIKSLTNKEISYIIITGGSSEIVGFKATAEEIFPSNIIIKSPKILGVRNSKYVTNIGLIENFYNKLLVKDKEFSMFSKEEIEEIISTKKQILNVNNESVVGRLFGYFFDN